MRAARSSAIWRRSRLVRSLITALVGSRLLTRLLTGVARVRTIEFDTDRLLNGSRLAAAWTLLAAATDQATITFLARNLESIARASFIYRWLTAEPDPEVVVIDLRETLSVGPVIAVLDWVVRLLVPASHRSTIVEAGETTHEYVRAAPIRAASLVVLVAVGATLALTIAVGDPTQFGVIARIVILALAALGTRITLAWGELVQTRPVRLLIAVLEPPDPPEERP